MCVCVSAWWSGSRAEQAKGAGILAARAGDFSALGPFFGRPPVPLKWNVQPSSAEAAGRGGPFDGAARNASEGRRVAFGNGVPRSAGRRRRRRAGCLPADGGPAGHNFGMHFLKNVRR